jgi:YD repeat-containing protein
MARAYLTGKSAEMTTRTWTAVLDEMEAGYEGSTLLRFQKVRRSAPFQLLRDLPLLETGSEDFLRVLRHPQAGNSTNKYLRIIHNRAQDLGWLLSPILARKVWPKVRERHPSAISWAEHQRVVEREPEPEFKLFYEMLWLTGGSQTDIVNLHRDNIDTVRRRLTYRRMKLNGRAHGGAALVIGKSLEELLAKLPQEGWLFPNIRLRSETDRGARFWKLCRRLKFKLSLHSYRYAWAERAKTCGMPMREAMAHLISMTDANGHTYSFAYDNLDRKVTTTYPDSSTENWSYDNAGNVSQ